MFLGLLLFCSFFPFQSVVTIYPVVMCSTTNHTTELQYRATTYHFYGCICCLLQIYNRENFVVHAQERPCEVLSARANPVRMMLWNNTFIDPVDPMPLTIPCVKYWLRVNCGKNSRRCLCKGYENDGSGVPLNNGWLLVTSVALCNR